MHEQYVQLELPGLHERHTEPPRPRRVLPTSRDAPYTQDVYDFSTVDFTHPVIAKRLSQAYEILLNTSRRRLAPLPAQETEQGSPRIQ